MADANEDLIRQPGGSATADASSDDEDSPQDFRLLASITRSQGPSTIPRRGLKDFEPDPTRLQSSTLAASRQAMHDALSYTRIHAPRGHVVGIFNPDNGFTRVRKPRGVNFKSLGKSVTGGAVDLFPEEALWMLERGTMDIKWGVDIDNSANTGVVNHIAEERIDDEESEGEGKVSETYKGCLPMSLQGAYAALIGEEHQHGRGLTLEKYAVYAGLKRAGFIVLRAEGFCGRKPTADGCAPSPAASANNVPPSNLSGWFHGILSQHHDRKSCRMVQRNATLVAPGIYKNYDDIFRQLQVSSSSHPRGEPFSSTRHGTVESPVDHHFTTTFNVYKPNPDFRRSAPGTPSFRICVVSTSDSTIPDLPQLLNLLDEQPQPSYQTKSNGVYTIPAMYQRLKQDGRNIILAIVDEGVVSYMRLSEAAFTQEKLYERRAKGSTKVANSRGKMGI